MIRMVYIQAQGKKKLTQEMPLFLTSPIYHKDGNTKEQPRS